MTNMRPPNKTILLKVVILGDGGVGKSCLMNRFVSNRYDENNFHTIGVEFMNKDIEVDGEKYTLQIWDTAGQERFRALRTPFYRGSDVCLLCYAINDRDSFCGLKQWRNEFLNYADVKADKFPFIVVGNKNDTAPRNRQVSFNEVQHWCDDHNITSLIETSSKTATNVTEAFSMAVRRWKHMERMAEIELRQQHGDTIDLTKTIRLGNSRFCCIGGGGGGGGCNVSSATASNYDSEEDSQLSSGGGTPRRQRHQQKHHRHQEQMNFTL